MCNYSEVCDNREEKRNMLKKNIYRIVRFAAKKIFQESGATAAHISLSHDGNYGIAYVVLEGRAAEEKIC